MWPLSVYFLDWVAVTPFTKSPGENGCCIFGHHTKKHTWPYVIVVYYGRRYFNRFKIILEYFSEIAIPISFSTLPNYYMKSHYPRHERSAYWPKTTDTWQSIYEPYGTLQIKLLYKPACSVSFLKIYFLVKRIIKYNMNSRTQNLWLWVQINKLVPFMKNRVMTRKIL